MKVPDILQVAVTAIDVDPAVVHLARAASPAINDAIRAGYDTTLSIPINLDDAPQLRSPGGFVRFGCIIRTKVCLSAGVPAVSEKGDREPCSVAQTVSAWA